MLTSAVFTAVLTSALPAPDTHPVVGPRVSARSEGQAVALGYAVARDAGWTVLMIQRGPGNELRLVVRGEPSRTA